MRIIHTCIWSSFYATINIFLTSQESLWIQGKPLIWSHLKIHRVTRPSCFSFQPFKKTFYNLFHLLSLKLWPNFHPTILLPQTTFIIMKIVWWPQIVLFALSSNILWLYRIPSFSVHCEVVQPMCSHSLKEVFISSKVNKRTPSWNGFGACFKGKTPLSYDTFQPLR